MVNIVCVNLLLLIPPISIPRPALSPHARAAQPSSSGGLLWLVDDGRIWWPESQMLLPFFSPGSPPLPLSPEARGGERRAAAPPRVVHQRERALMALLPHPHAGGSHPEGPRPGHHRTLTIRVIVSDVWRPARVLPDPVTPAVVQATASTTHRARPVSFPVVLGATAPCP